MSDAIVTPARKNAHHGMSRTRLYSIWRNMVGRCTNPNATRYENWGGRGITVCERWRVFSNFYADMGKCPDEFSIDRIDNDKGYYKENCKWSSRSEQQRNKRAQRSLTGVTGVHQTRNRARFWACIRADGKTINLGAFDTIEEAAAARKAGEVKYWGH